MSLVRVKIDGTREEVAKAFYFMMTHGSVYSDKYNEFVVGRKLIDLLKENGINFQVVNKPPLIDLKKVKRR